MVLYGTAHKLYWGKETACLALHKAQPDFVIEYCHVSLILPVLLAAIYIVGNFEITDTVNQTFFSHVYYYS